MIKYTGIYRCPDDIRNFKISITLKELKENSTKKTKEKLHKKTFIWQQKHFTKFEREFYGDESNCFTDIEKNYNRIITENTGSNNSNNILSNYVENDRFSPEDADVVNSAKNLNYIEQHLKNTNFFDDDNCKKICGLSSDYDFNRSLQSSYEFPVGLSTDYEKMYLIADLGEFIENTWIRHEEIVCTIKYNKLSKSLLVYPDFNNDKTPYRINVDESSKKYEYVIENCSECQAETIQMNEKDLQKKINKQKAPSNHINFEIPAKNKLVIYTFFEIQSAKGFEYADIFIQYFVDLSETKWICNDMEALRGVTQSCNGDLGHFNHSFEFALEYNLQDINHDDLPKSPYIYFEVFSKDNWDRYRTEGISYTTLPLSIKNDNFLCQKLHCFRLVNNNNTSELRRFFIGDCQNYDDLPSWVAVPKDQLTMHGDNNNGIINKFGINTAGTGEIHVKINTVHQSQAFIHEFNDDKTVDRMIFEKLNSSCLIKSVEQVLRAFKKARNEMIESREK